MARPLGKRVWIVVGWAHTPHGFAYSSTDEQRWHWTKKSAVIELRAAQKRWTGTNWMIVRMHPMYSATQAPRVEPKGGE